MSTIVMANTKGGSGKTTTTLILAGELVAAGARVAIIEGDRNRALSEWAEGRAAPLVQTRDVAVKSAKDAATILASRAGSSKVMVVASREDDEDVMTWINGAASWAQFVICDPEGSRNAWLSDVISQADLVIVPFAPTTIDVRQVASTVKLIRNASQRSHSEIPHAVIIVKANGIATKSERMIRQDIADTGLPLFDTTILERAAYRELFTHDALLSELTEAEASGLDQARRNAREFAAEVLARLKSAQARSAA